MNKEEIEESFLNLQQSIINQLQDADGKGVFGTDRWYHHQGGGGISRVLNHGRIIEKGGVNFSAVSGTLSPAAAKALEMTANEYYATGVSIVLHPYNPFVPIIHMNVRYFETENGRYWFGGGIDLTPHYVDSEDARYFHLQLKEVCDKFNQDFYSKYKEWADNYFFLPHRDETRGVGGIFFDRLNEESTGMSKSDLAQFVLAIGNLFAPVYSHFMEKNSKLPFGESNKHWQSIRRGRYVEFNLAFDRGTKFGLETGGRTESILMSLPSSASWEYNFQPKEGTPEFETLSLLKKGINWTIS
ncbi:MAG: oxygen-dependent coproporphyrinogen oxidase [Bacteroidia bacterium]